MDGISLFSYFPGTSLLHRFDPRLKMAVVIAFSVAVFIADSSGLIMLSLMAAVLLKCTGYPLLRRQSLRQLRGIFVLALLIFIGRTLFSVHDTPVIMVTSGDGGSPLREGLQEGITGAWRLLLFAAGGLLFTVSTSTIKLQDGIASVLRPVPFIPEQKFATMMGLTITFVPVIFTISREISEVHRSRGISPKKCPFRRIQLFSSHVMAAVLQYTDDISSAMESRGYGGSRTKPRFSPGWPDALLLLLFAGGISAALLLDARLPLF